MEIDRFHEEVGPSVPQAAEAPRDRTARRPPDQRHVAADSLRAVFGPELVSMSGTAAAVPQGSGNASLGVLRVRGAELVAPRRDDRSDLRVHFTDPDFGDLRIRASACTGSAW